MKKIFALIALVALAACADDDGTRRALASSGFTDIKTEGYAFFGCSEDDQFRTRFKATGPTGSPATGQVCGGWFKGSTIRLD